MRGVSTILGVLLMLLLLISFTVTLTHSLQSTLGRAGIEIREALAEARAVSIPVKARISGGYVEAISEGPLTRVLAVIERLSNGTVIVLRSSTIVGSEWTRITDLVPGYRDVWVIFEGGKVIKALPPEPREDVGIGDVGAWYFMLMSVSKYVAFQELGPVAMYTYTPESEGTTYVWQGETAELAPSSTIFATNVTLINSSAALARFSACNSVRYYQVGIIGARVFRYVASSSTRIKLAINAAIVRDAAPAYERDFVNVSLIAYVIPGSSLPYHFVTMPTYLQYLDNVDYANFGTYPRIAERVVLWRGTFLRDGVYSVSNVTAVTLLPGEGYVFVGIELNGCPGTVEARIDVSFSG